MKFLFVFAACLAVTPFYISATAAQGQPCDSEAALSETIVTTAEVTTSYGSAYRVETYYRTPSETAARFVTQTPALMAIEGPFVWTRTEGGAVLGGEDERRFILGHQFHALAFHFDAIMSNIEGVKDIPFEGKLHDGRKGFYPEGGAAAMILDDNGKPLGLILSLPGETPLKVAYGDWRETAAGRTAPHTVIITHKDNTYTYQYDEIAFGVGDQQTFQDLYPVPPIEAVARFRATAEKCAVSNNQ